MKVEQYAQENRDPQEQQNAQNALNAPNAQEVAEAEIPDAIVNRKGARKASEIPAEVIALLVSGRIETANLTEWLAVDHAALLEHVLSELSLLPQATSMLSSIQQLTGQPTMKIVPAIAAAWMAFYEPMSVTEREALFGHLAMHRSDSVRCWAAYIVGLSDWELEKKLEQIRPFAADHHFGVREIAWMAVREETAAHLKAAVSLLSGWVLEEDANLRRFAVELTRPRGVWARHIAMLKENPAMALPLLEPLKADPSKYVQDSVANWLNDASKSQPDWVVQVCEAWLRISGAPATQRIAVRAQRSMGTKEG